MKIKKGDVLYILNQCDISDIDGECEDSFIEIQNRTNTNCSDVNFDQSLCPFYRKCWLKPQKVTLSVYRVSNVKSRIRPSVTYYHMINKKDNTRNKITCMESHTGKKYGFDKLDMYAKSEKGAYVKFLSQLKKNIKKMKQGKEVVWLYRSVNIKSYVSLQKRIEKKIKGWDNGKG